MIPGRRSHDVRPMSPTVVPSERRPSASEELSRPSLQNLPLSNSDSGSGRGDSSGHFVGDAVSRRLGFLGVGDSRPPPTSAFLPPRSHSRVDSNGTRDAPSNMSSSTLVSASKQHVSPSKVCADLFHAIGPGFCGVVGGSQPLIHPSSSTIPTGTPTVRLINPQSSTLLHLINSTDAPALGF